MSLFGVLISLTNVRAQPVVDGGEGRFPYPVSISPQLTWERVQGAGFRFNAVMYSIQADGGG